MYFVNLILFFSAVILICSLVCIRRIAPNRYGTLVFGSLFLFLLVLLPLFSNIVVGRPVTVKIGDGEVFDDIYVLLVYSVAVMCFSVVFSTTSFFLKSVFFFPLCSTTSRLSIGSIRRDFGLHFLAGLLSVIGVGVFVYGTGMSVLELFIASRFEWFARGTAVPFFLNLGFYLISLVSVYAYFDVKRGLPIKWLSFVVYGAVAFMIIVAGGRKWILFIASGALAAYYDKLGRRFILRKKMMFSVLLVVFFSFSWQYYRALDWHRNLSSSYLVQGLFEKTPELFVKGDITYFYRASLEAIRLNVDKKFLVPFGVIRRMVFLPVPASWTKGLKPEDLAAMFSDAIGAGDTTRRGNMPPGLVGLFVVSFGWIGAILLMGPMVMFFVLLVDKLSFRKVGMVRDVVIANFFVTSVLLLRGSESSVYFLVFQLFVVFLCKYLVFPWKTFLKSATVAKY